jgi:hypothetical protein
MIVGYKEVAFEKGVLWAELLCYEEFKSFWGLS